MLRLVPRYPAKVDTTSLQRALQDEGFSTTTRTIQRDLNTLSSIFPLTVDEREKPFGWSWAKSARVMDIPGITPPAALAFRLAESHLADLLPPSVLDYLEPHFQRAREVLKTTSLGGFKAWSDKVHVIPRGLRLKPAKVEADVQHVVYEALLARQRFSTLYLPRDGEQAVEYEVNPLALVLRQGVTYLVATLWDYDDVKHLALHRMQSATPLDHKARQPGNFRIDDYLESGAFAYPVSTRKIKLRALFDIATAHHLLETPLADDQTLKADGEEHMLLKATVDDSAELRWWLLGFGDGVEILSPKRLRQEFRNVAIKLGELYK